MRFPEDAVDIFLDHDGLRATDGQPIVYPQDNSLHIVLQSGLIVINKPSIAEHASLEQDMAGDIRYCADVLDSSPADAARSLGWMKGRLLTQFVAFNELAFPNYLKISGMEVEEAGDIIEKHVGVNHQLVALKPYLSQ